MSVAGQLETMASVFEFARAGDIELSEVPLLFRHSMREVITASEAAEYREVCTTTARALADAVVALQKQPTLPMLAAVEAHFLLFKVAASDLTYPAVRLTNG